LVACGLSWWRTKGFSYRYLRK